MLWKYKIVLTQYALTKKKIVNCLANTGLNLCEIGTVSANCVTSAVSSFLLSL